MKFEKAIQKYLIEAGLTRIRIKNPTISDKPQLYKIMDDDTDWIIKADDYNEAKQLFMKKKNNFVSIKIKKPTDADYENISSIKDIQNKL